jgi:hypothetical protein
MNWMGSARCLRGWSNSEGELSWHMKHEETTITHVRLTLLDLEHMYPICHKASEDTNSIAQQVLLSRRVGKGVSSTSPQVFGLSNFSCGTSLEGEIQSGLTKKTAIIHQPCASDSPVEFLWK